MASRSKDDAKNSEHDGASPGKIFIGGLPKDTSMATFTKNFGKYGEIDSVIMKDGHSQQPRGFEFITYSDPSVVDQVIEENHIINGKQILKSGPLFIPSKGIGWTSWKKRWFVLSRKSLMFYRADPNALPQKGSEAPNPTLGGIELNNPGSVVVKQDKKLLTVLFSDGRGGRAFTLKTETLDELNEWKTALEDALAQAPSASHVLGQNGIFCNDVADIIEASVEQCMDILPTTSLIVGRPVLYALEDIDGPPSFLEKALSFIEEYGIKVEGILRQSADVEEVVRRVQEYEQGKNEFSSDEDAHVIGDCIKHVLREMPSPPVPASCCTALVDAYRTDRVCRVDYIRDAIYETFPESNRRLLQRTLKMMRTVAAHKAENRMSISAVAACMAPLLLRPLLAGESELKNDFQIDDDGSFQLLQAVAAANHAQAIVIILLEEYVKIFDNESSSSESDDEEDIEDYESTDNDILQEVGYYHAKNELKSHLVGDLDCSYSGTSCGNDSDVVSEDNSDLGIDIGSYAGSDAAGNNVDNNVGNNGGNFMKSVACSGVRSSLSRDEARKNLSVESIEFTSDDESAVHRLENDKIDLQTKISKEIEGNTILQTSLDMRKEALHEHRLALEKEVVMLQVRLQKERDLRLHLEFGLMDIQSGHFFNSACLDSKTRMDLEEIALSVRDINILKQNIADITEQLQQDHATLCESCGRPIYRYKQENVYNIPNVQKHDHLFKHGENAISSGDSDSSPVKDLTNNGYVNAMKKLTFQSARVPFSEDVDSKKQAQDSLSSKNQQPIFEHQRRLSNQDNKVSTIQNSKFVESYEVVKKSSSNVENIIVDSENLEDEVKCSTVLVDIQSFQNLPPKISNHSSTKSSGASTSSEDWHTASKMVERWDYTKKDAPVSLKDQITPLHNTSTRRHAPSCEEGASSSSALTKLTNRLNFLKERRVKLANELQNLDPSRATGPDSPSKTNSG